MNLNLKIENVNGNLLRMERVLRVSGSGCRRLFGAAKDGHVHQANQLGE